MAYGCKNSGQDATAASIYQIVCPVSSVNICGPLHRFLQYPFRIMEIINGKLIDKITTYDEYLESDAMARKRFTFTVAESDEEDD